MGKKKTYIDLFAGCGGLSLGLHNSGLWKGLFAVEKSADAFKTLEHNLMKTKRHFSWPNWLPKEAHDINEVISNYSTNLKTLRGSIDLVAGGPPCQGFSTAGKRQENDSRNKLIDSYIDFIQLVQPKVIFFENVKGFTQKFDKNKAKGIVYSEYVKTRLSENDENNDYNGYHVFGRLVNFAEFGVPQKRTRFILVGVRKDLNAPKAPELFFEKIFENREAFLSKKDLSLTTSLKDAISDLLRIEETVSPDTPSFQAGIYGSVKSPYQQLLKGKVTDEIADSHRFPKHTKQTTKKLKYILKYADRDKTISPAIKEKFGIKKRTLIPLSGDTPTPTITTGPDDYVHYCEPRIFTVREYARIQSFNDWYEFKGKYTTGGLRRKIDVPRYSQIGNAIPPLFGEQAAITLSNLI